MSQRHSEAAFETVIETYLLANGYVTVNRDSFDRERAIFPETVLAFIRATQLKEWARLEALHREKTGEQILSDLCKWMDANGALATLRHGFKCYGRTLHVAYFKAAHELNPELEARYAANRLGLTRQLHFSPRSEQSLDVTLSLNGIPVATLELKNPLTGQMVEEARRQYMQDRDPREPIFEFKRRTLVHFAVDTEAVFMTTRLAGSATLFLPFNKGCDGGAGNPPDPAGRTYRTAYLWEEVLQRVCLHSVGHPEAWPVSPRLAQKAWKSPLSLASRNAKTLRKPGWLPAHACSLEPTLDDMLACPLHRAGADGEPDIPGLLVSDSGSVPLHIANQLDQRVADGLLPWPQALERTDDLSHAVHEERSHFLLHPGLGSSRVIGVEEVGKGIEMLAEMIIIQRLTHPWEVGLRHVPNPGCTISENLPHGDGLPARIADDLLIRAAKSSAAPRIPT